MAETAKLKAGNITKLAQCRNGKTVKRRNGKCKTAGTDGTTMAKWRTSSRAERGRGQADPREPADFFIYIYIYIYMYVCTERERERDIHTHIYTHTSYVQLYVMHACMICHACMHVLRTCSSQSPEIPES